MVQASVFYFTRVKGMWAMGQLPTQKLVKLK